MLCKNCGFELDSENFFCHKCGAKAEEEIMNKWDEKNNKIVSYKNYVFSDEYGYFLRSFEDDSEETIVAF